MREDWAVADKKEDPWAINSKNGRPAEKEPDPNAPRDPNKLSYEATVGGSIADLFTGGNADVIIQKLKDWGLASKDAPTQKTSEAIKENPKSAAFGTALGMALPVAGVESLIGTGARAAGSALGGESALAAGGRAALAEGGVSGLAEGAKAATGNEADWMNPIYNAAFGGVLGGFGQKAADLLKSPAEQAAKTIRGRVGDVPDTFRPGNVRGDPTPTLRPGEVAQTAPEALKAAGLGEQAGKAEELLRQTLGGQAPVVPGRDAQLAAGTATRDAATKAAEDAMQQVGAKQVKSPFGNAPDLQNIHFQTAGARPPGDASLMGFGASIDEAMKQAAGNPAIQRQIDDALAHLHGQGHPQVGNLFEAERLGKQFEDFKGSFGVTPAAKTPGMGGWAAGKMASGVGNMAKGHTGIAGPILNPLIDMATGALQKVIGNLPQGMPRNAAIIENILREPTKFSSILKPEEMAALTKLAALRAGAASGAGEMASNAPDQRLEAIRRKYPAAY
jgi:hypothetical protein